MKIKEDQKRERILESMMHNNSEIGKLKRILLRRPGAGKSDAGLSGSSAV